MPTASALRTVLNAVRAHKGAPAQESFAPELRLREDLGLDSIDLAELTARLDHEFGVDVFADGPVQTVGEVLARVERSARRG